MSSPHKGSLFVSRSLCLFPLSYSLLSLLFSLIHSATTSTSISLLFPFYPILSLSLSCSISLFSTSISSSLLSAYFYVDHFSLLHDVMTSLPPLSCFSFHPLSFSLSLVLYFLLFHPSFPFHCMSLSLLLVFSFHLANSFYFCFLYSSLTLSNILSHFHHFFFYSATTTSIVLLPSLLPLPVTIAFVL